eukprot:750859-Hanusia_phi.AAC.4
MTSCEADTDCIKRSSSSPRPLDQSDSIRDLQGLWDDSFWQRCKCSIAGLGPRQKVGRATEMR